MFPRIQRELLKLFGLSSKPQKRSALDFRAETNRRLKITSFPAINLENIFAEIDLIKQSMLRKEQRNRMRVPQYPLQ